jgi:hypothetical protein
MKSQIPIIALTDVTKADVSKWKNLDSIPNLLTKTYYIVK